MRQQIVSWGITSLSSGTVGGANWQHRMGRDIMSQRFTVHSVQLSIIFMNMLESLTDQFASLGKK